MITGKLSVTITRGFHSIIIAMDLIGHCLFHEITVWYDANFREILWWKIKWMAKTLLRGGMNGIRGNKMMNTKMLHKPWDNPTSCDIRGSNLRRPRRHKLPNMTASSWAARYTGYAVMHFVKLEIQVAKGIWTVANNDLWHALACAKIREIIVYAVMVTG